MRRRIAVTLLAVWAIASLPACGKTDAGGEPEVQAGLNEEGKYHPGITIMLGSAQDPNEEEIAGQTSKDNVWIDAYRDELGIEFDNMFVVNPEQLEEKLNLQIASGQVPDLMSVTRKQFEMLVSSGLAADLTEVYEQYASEKTKEYLNADGGICMNMAKSDGKLYALPCTHGYLESPGVVTWIRKDWLDNLNLEIPQTYEQLYEVMRAFTYDDPDGNGLDDTYAVSTSNTLDEWMGLFASYGSYPKSWIQDKNGEIVYGGVQPETRNALEAMHTMFEEGMISREFGANDWNQFIKSIDNSNVGIVYFAWYAVDWPLGDVHRESGAEWIPLPIMSADGGTAKVMGAAGPDVYYVMRKGYEHPEALIHMFNLWFEKAYGSREDMLKYHKNEKGEQIANFSPIHPWLAHEDVEYYCKIRDSLAGQDVGEMFPSCQTYYEGVQRYMDTGNEDDYFTYKMYGPDSGCAVLNEYMENDLVLFEQYYGSGTKTMKEKWGVLETKQLETYVKIIMGEESIEAFDAFAEEWNSNGGEQITREIREAAKANE